MTISTQDCKHFINSISTIIGVSTNDTWNRTKKYKQDAFVLRDFENKKGTTITICEHNGVLTLYSLQSVAPVDNYPAKNEIIQEFIEPGMKYIGKEINEHDVAIFLSECATLNPFIEDLDVQESAKNPKNWKIIEATFPNSYTIYDLEYKDEEGYRYSIEEEDVIKVYWFRLGPNYDTMYRYFVFETKGQYLCLGTNEPD